MTDANPFDACQSLDEIMAIIHDQLGADGLNEFIKVSADVLCQQGLQEAAEQLQAAGLPQVAEVALEAAEHAPRAQRWKSHQQHQAEIEANRRYWGRAEWS